MSVDVTVVVIESWGWGLNFSATNHITRHLHPSTIHLYLYTISRATRARANAVGFVVKMKQRKKILSLLLFCRH
jgi:hypothetical protein